MAAIPNWYQVSMNKDNILDFMKEWEFARKTFSKGEQILDLPVQYKYNATKITSSRAVRNLVAGRDDGHTGWPRFPLLI